MDGDVTKISLSISSEGIKGFPIVHTNFLLNKLQLYVTFFASLSLTTVTVLNYSAIILVIVLFNNQSIILVVTDL